MASLAGSNPAPSVSDGFRAAVLGANDGRLYAASLVMGAASAPMTTSWRYCSENTASCSGASSHSAGRMQGARRFRIVSAGRTALNRAPSERRWARG